MHGPSCTPVRAAAPTPFCMPPSVGAAQDRLYVARYVPSLSLYKIASTKSCPLRVLNFIIHSCSDAAATITPPTHLAGCGILLPPQRTTCLSIPNTNNKRLSWLFCIVLGHVADEESRLMLPHQADRVKWLQTWSIRDASWQI